MKHFDYIFLGGGCAATSLLIRLQQAGLLQNKTVLIVEQASSSKSERTWCFWEKDAGYFESLVYKNWGQAWFYGPEYSNLLSLNPYQYKMIRGSDFYAYAEQCLREQPGIEIIHGMVSEAQLTNGELYLKIDDLPHQYKTEMAFSSIWNETELRAQSTNYFMQHFKGWIINTATPTFKSDEATLMDFRVSQQNGAAFVYTLPFSATEALVEYTLFSKQLLHADAYDDALKEYIKTVLLIDSYEVTKTEYGVIPMTAIHFPPVRNGIYTIGTAGGQTKASSGYTFRFIQKQTTEIVRQLKVGKPDLRKTGKQPRRYNFYDDILLEVLAGAPTSGAKIFAALFKHNPPGRIFRFLDNESNLVEELGVIASLPVLPFLRAAFSVSAKHLWRNKKRSLAK